MEWVETTGKTVDDAKDLALDQLGVDEQDAEFEILEEPRTGLFGRLRGEARVRARVRPTQPRPKQERRDRKGKGARGGPGRGRGGKVRNDAGRTADSRSAATDSPTPAEPAAQPRGGDAGTTTEVAPRTDESPDQRRASREGGSSRPARRERRPRTDRTDDEESIEMSDTELAAQGEVAREFLLDLLDAFGLEGEVTATPAEEGAVELAVTGSDLGLLIGPKGQTLQAIQELARTALQRQHPGDVHAKVRVDVAGYRQRRREALERFVRQVAEDVRSSGSQKALEPMSPPDRKVVHDTVNTIDGVRTISEGEDTRRRVVILPD